MDCGQIDPLGCLHEIAQCPPTPPRENETICVASTLLFSSRASLAYFLNECDAGDFGDKLVEVSAVQQDGAPTSIYGILVGAAGYASHYGIHEKKTRPNAVLRASPAAGPNDGFLALTACTHNESLDLF